MAKCLRDLWLDDVAENRHPQLSTGARSTVAWLGKWMNQAGECWPSEATIARARGVTPRTVRRDLAELRAAGILERRWEKRTIDEKPRWMMVSFAVRGDVHVQGEDIHVPPARTYTSPKPSRNRQVEPSSEREQEKAENGTPSPIPPAVRDAAREAGISEAELPELVDYALLGCEITSEEDVQSVLRVIAWKQEQAA